MANSRYCPNCGGDINADTQPKFCRHCGHRLTSTLHESNRYDPEDATEESQSGRSANGKEMPGASKEKCFYCGNSWPRSYFATKDMCFDCFHKLPLDAKRRINPSLVPNEETHSETLVGGQSNNKERRGSELETGFIYSLARALVSVTQVFSLRRISILVAITAILTLSIMGYSALFGHSKEFDAAKDMYQHANLAVEYQSAYGQFSQVTTNRRDHDEALMYLDSTKMKLILAYLDYNNIPRAISWTDSLKGNPSSKAFQELLFSDAQAYAQQKMWTPSISYTLCGLCLDSSNYAMVDSLRGFVRNAVKQMNSNDSLEAVIADANLFMETVPDPSGSMKQFIDQTRKQVSLKHIENANRDVAAACYQIGQDEAKAALKWDKSSSVAKAILAKCQKEISLEDKWERQHEGPSYANQYFDFNELAESFESMTQINQDQWNKDYDDQYLVKGTGAISDIKEAGLVDQISSGISGEYYEIDLELQNGYHAVLFFPKSGRENWIRGFYKGENISYRGKLKNLTNWGFWVTGYIVGD